jgi:tetraacyldisaccharide 4'-kinase
MGHIFSIYAQKICQIVHRCRSALWQWGDDVIHDRRSDMHRRILAPLLLLLTFPFAIAIFFRKLLYKCRVLRTKKLEGCVVISVGNLSIGGTGKTPMVEFLARKLLEHGRHVAILSRGYGGCHSSRPMRKSFPRVVCDGYNILLPVEVAGDEAFMLAKRLKNVPIISHGNRVIAGQMAIDDFSCDTLILDDGFQYFQLQTQYSILLIDATNPFGNGHLLPRGILREPKRHMARASHIFLTKCSGNVEENLLATIRKYGKINMPIVEFSQKPLSLCSYDGKKSIPLQFLHGKHIAAFSAIANAENFEKILKDLGVILCDSWRFVDHHPFSLRQLKEIGDRAKKNCAEMVICTEKDIVKIGNAWQDSLPLFFLPIEIYPIRGKEFLENLLGEIGNNLPQKY